MSHSYRCLRVLKGTYDANLGPSFAPRDGEAPLTRLEWSSAGMRSRAEVALYWTHGLTVLLPWCSEASRARPAGTSRGLTTGCQSWSSLRAYPARLGPMDVADSPQLEERPLTPTGVITIATADEFGAVMQFQYMRDKRVVLRRPVRVSEEEARRIVWTTRLVKSGRRDVGSLVEMIIAVEDITGMPYGEPPR